MIRVVAVLSNLNNAEEAIAVESKLAVDLSIDLESQRTTGLLQLSELILQSFVLLARGRVVDPCVQDSPVLATGGTLQVPVTNHMRV